MKTLLFGLSILLMAFRMEAQTCQALFSFDATNLTIHFQDQSTHTANNPIISWSWDFDDGSTSTQQNPIHTFADPDRYDVNLTIHTQNGCTDNVQIRIEICDFGVNYTIGSCNASGQVPVSFMITDIFNNAKEADVILDGQSVPGSPFQINLQNPVNISVSVPGDGLSHTIHIQSTDIETCGRTIQFVTPDCSSNCFLSVLNTAFAGGITHNVSIGNNFFSPQSVAISLGDVVHFTWQGGGHSTTSDVTTGPDSWNSGVIANGSTFDVNIHNPGTHNYYCQPHGGPGGVGMSGQILSNCPTGNTLPLTVHFNTTMANPAGYNILWDNVNVSGSPFQYSGTGIQTRTINIAGDGMMHSLIIRDITDPTCELQTNYGAPDCGQGGGNPVCGISGTVGNFGGCSNNNVSATLTVTVTNGGPGFNVSIDNGANTFNTYSGNITTLTITLPGNGVNHTVKITDSVDPTCMQTINVITPDCTIPCGITNLTATPASANGGPSGVVHTVNVQDFQFNPSIVNITVGDLVKWVWTGAISHTTTSDAASGANSWNSGLLNNGAMYMSPLLTEGTHPYYCVPHGAPGGVGMSGTINVLPPCNANGETNVVIAFNVVSNNAQGFQVLVDGVVTGTFAYVGGTTQTASVLVQGNGMPHAIEVRDVADQTCSATASVTTANCGGGNPVCSLSFTPTIGGGCLNGSVAVTLNVTALNNSAAYSVTVDSLPAGTFNYSNPSASVNIAGDGQAHTIAIADSVTLACTMSSAITLPDCSQPCNLSISNLSFGVNVAHLVQVQDFQFSPSEITINLGDTLNFSWTGVIPHSVTSDASAGPNAFNSGLLSQGATWQFIPNATGSFPFYCIPHGAPGGVGMSGTIHVTSLCEGSLANGNLELNYTGTSGQGFIVMEDSIGIPGSPFAFSASGHLTIPIVVNGDGVQHLFTVKDAGNALCIAQHIATVPSCNQVCILAITNVLVSECIGNTVTLTINISSNQPAMAYNVYKDGLRLNPMALMTDANGNGTYSTMVVGNNISTNIVVQFVENATCMISQNVVVPGCAGPCLISNFEVGKRGVRHIVEVKDFAFVPSSIDVLIGDTIQFVWTGSISHTTTSDQFSGPNSWNSGLLGLGSTFDLVIHNTGMFPFYCQPHGGPGGIGMSGVIHVKDTCIQENWQTNMSFNVSAGSPLGYNVFVDGVKITDTPIHYDNPLGFNDEIVGLPGDGAWHLITMQDLETGFCAYTTPVLTSICGAGCSVINLNVNVGANITHVIEVRDFDYFPKQITVGAGEKIRFVWKGEIQHTVTSDALTGPEVWNSGLLGMGASYDLIINTPGVHPYFCIPHGGPNGIGMSGVITVLPACVDFTQNVQADFDVTHGSIQGYNLFVDGFLFGTNPRHYDDRRGSNQITIQYPADNIPHILTIQDLENNICAASDFFTMGICDTSSCALNGLDYVLGNGRKIEVMVRDFAFEPSDLRVELGDTIHFVWTGSIPHTVTSDISTGVGAFNSGLQAQGSTFDLVLTTTGSHPYYCIPHGAPGGIGMSGNIDVADPCTDGKVFVDFIFFAEGPGASYDVANQNNIIINDKPYQTGGVQSFTLEMSAQGQSYNISVNDNGTGGCMASIAIDTLDCSDPCFMTTAHYNYNINYSSLEVAFYADARGDISSWHWDFGDGTFSDLKDPVHTFSAATIFLVCLTIQDVHGCTDVYCDKIRLGADVCNASFTYEQNGLDIVFYNTSDVSDPSVSAMWTFGDGGSSTNFDSIAHQYTLGLYEICITVTSSGCVNTYCDILDLTNSCLALNAKYQVDVIEGNPLAYQLTDQSTGMVGSYLWGFGDGQISTSQHPTHQYTQTGVYTVCLLILDPDGQCADSACRTLYVGTTGTFPDEIMMKKISLSPNPVSSGNPKVRLSGFAEIDLGTTAKSMLYDATGANILIDNLTISKTNDLNLPSIPGVYFLQVITERNRYGIMVVVQ